MASEKQKCSVSLPQVKKVVKKEEVEDLRNNQEHEGVTGT